MNLYLSINASSEKQKIGFDFIRPTDEKLYPFYALYFDERSAVL
jgi:hypothetical protein